MFKLKYVNFAPLLGVTILFGVYYSAFVYDFGFHNDYRIFEYDNSDPFALYPETYHLFLIGRWLGAILLNLHLMWIHDVESMSLWRFVSFLFVVGLFILFNQSLKNGYHIKPLEAFTISLLIFCLPGIQLNTLWLTNLTPGIITIYLSLYAYYHLDKLRLSAGMFKELTLYKALFLFLLALWIYPPNAMFFLLITFCQLLFQMDKNWIIVRAKIIRDIIFVSFSSGVYFLLTKLVVIPLSLYLISYDAAQIVNYHYKFSDTWDIEVFLDKLYQLYLFSMQGWEITFSGNTINSITILLLASIYIHYLTLNIPHKQRVINLIQKIFLATLIFIVLNSPYLVAEWSFLAFRTSIISVSFFICLIVWSVSIIINRLGRISYYLAVIVLISYSVLTAKYNMDTMVMNNHLEYQFVKEQFQKAPKNFKTLLIFRTVIPRYVFRKNGYSYREKTFVQRPLSKDISNTGTYPGAFIFGLLYSFFDQLGINKNNVKIKITYSYNDVLINRRKKDVFILDFSKSSLDYYDYNGKIRWNPFALMNPR